MPSQVPTSFASAAAAAGGVNHDWTARGSGSGRSDGPGVLDWSRPRANGAGTATFRRPSLATSLSQPTMPQASHGHGANAVSTPGPYVPPHHYQSHMGRNGDVADCRFAKDVLLDVYKTQRDAGDLGKNLADLLMGDWQPGGGMSASSGSIWSRKDESSKDGASGADICWDVNGSIVPLGLLDMTDAEKEHFSTSVNSPLKPPPQSSGKDSNPANVGMSRKTSFTQASNTGAPFGMASPTSVRPPGRHRELSESYSLADNAAASPIGSGRAAKDDGNTQTPPPLLLRRRTELGTGLAASGLADRDKEPGSREAPAEAPASFASFPRRSITIGAGGTAMAPSSPWASGGAGFSPMGSFGNFGAAEGTGQPPTPGEKKGGFAGTRSTSRWSKFMGKGYGEDGASTDRLSVGNLGKLSETDVEPSSHDWIEARANRPLSNDTDPFGDREGADSLAAVAATQSALQPQQHQSPRYGTPTAPGSREGLGFAEVGGTSMLTGLRDVPSDHDNQQYAGATPQNVSGDGEPLSPTETNPYQSPVPEKADPEDIDTDDSDIQQLAHPALGGGPNQAMPNRFPAAPGPLPAGFDGLAHDQSQPFGEAAFKRFSSLAGLGGMTGTGAPAGWPTGSGLLSGAERDHGLFAADMGRSVFGSMADLQTSNLAATAGGISGVGFGDAGAGNRGSRLGSLFPPAMQSQMHGGDSMDQGRRTDLADSGILSPLTSGVEHLARSSHENFRAAYAPAVTRDNDTPSMMPKGMFEDLLPSTADGTRERHAADRSSLSRDPSSRASLSAQVSEALQAAPPAASNAAAPNVTQASHAVAPPGSLPAQPAATAAQTAQIPQAQQRTMVMPDRMRWIYKDPQGNIQGPWSGLEMHDWFKAGFFSAELLVKKYEDPEFEPLGQLIRRIGNSREPFLVPQIGIPHGPPSNQTGSPWNAGNNASGSQTSPAGSVQPPFAGAFPSFGTTLTAEQQNALERRKQEEQYLMARQKEYLAQQQVLHKQMQQMHGVHPQQLHHHSSAHSLHSQPSFGSMTSPNAFHPTPPQGPIQHPQPVPPFFDAHMRHGNPAYMGGLGLGAGEFAGSGPGAMREEDLAALLARQNLSRDGQQPAAQGFGASPPFHQQQQQQPQQPQPQDNQSHPPHVAAMLAQRAQLQREQAKHDAMLVPSSDEQQAPNDRLEEFKQLRAQLEEEQHVPQGEAAEVEAAIASLAGSSDPGSLLQRHQHQPQPFPYLGGGQPDVQAGEAQDNVTPIAPAAASPPSQPTSQQEPETLSLTQQVQRAASGKKEPVSAAPHTDASWERGDRAGLPHPFPPPPPSVSPLPAPAAQRSRQQLPDALAIQEENRVRSQTSSVETPGAISSVAPWAKEATDGPKGPSLKEIQEAEARKAARAEEMAAAARRALLEQERERLSQQSGSNSASPTGLPSSSTWGSVGSPLTPTSAGGASVWAKASTTRSGLATGEGAAKKTLSQIQKEEEARKQKAAMVAVDSSNNTGGGVAAGGVSTGKRYADLASKAAASSMAVASGGGGAWTTVGAAGKAKAAPQTAPGLNAGSGGARTTSSSVATASKAKPALTSARSSTAAVPSPGPTNANEEFIRWAKAALSKGLNSSINVDDFVQQLLMFPAEAEIISESVYANSQTMDGRRFAMEFLRRRKLAEKGIVEGAGPGSGGAGATSTSAASGGNSKGNDSKNPSGWNEVAKKGSSSSAANKDGAEGHSAFKVVAAKKKGRR